MSVWLDTNPVVIEMARKKGSCVMNFEMQNTPATEQKGIRKEKNYENSHLIH